MPYETDGLVGKIALQKGMISSEQLKECLAQQSALQKAGQKRPLGVILVSRGILRDEDLLDLLEDQKKYLSERSNYTQIRREDFLFGQILIKQGALTAEQLNGALRIQAEAAEAGASPVPRLGQILVEKGMSDEKTVQQTLRLQYKALYECPGCGLQYNLVNAREDKQYRCKKCGTLLARKPAGSGLKAHETAFGVRLEVDEELPPEVAEAEKKPDNRFDKYVLVKEVGRGGSGSVYKAYQKDLKRTLALKLLRGVDPEHVERFHREAQTAARLKHPNIVSVYEIGKYKEVAFLAMEFIDGRPLGDERLPVRKVCAILRDVAQAVHYAHEKGVIHRDLKPANILLDQDHRPYVTDFGLARQVTGVAKELTLAGLIVGTPAYMSPEQARGARELDAQSDVASLGSVLYKLLTDVPPYAGKTPMDTALAVIHKEPLAPRQINPAVSPSLEAVCLKAMEKNKARRYPTARALAEDLQRYLEGEPVTAQQPGPVSVALRRLKKHKLVAGVVAGAAAVILILSFVLLSISREARRNAELLEAKLAEERGEFDRAEALYDRHSPADAERLKRRLSKAPTPPPDEAPQPKPKPDPRRGENRARAEELVAQAEAATSPADRVRLATKAIELSAELEEPYVLRGRAYETLGFFEAAYSDLGKASQISKNPVPHYIARSDLARRLGRVEDEISNLDIAIRLDPGSADLFQRRGSARFVARDYPAAAADWERAVAMDPSLAKALEPRIKQAKLNSGN